jgi:DNA-binding response OmpR family regulator
MDFDCGQNIGNTKIMTTYTGNSISQELADQPAVLVAEDDEQISYLLQFLLEREGFRVLLARDGQEARRLIDEIAPPKLTILDVMMPYADGFELLARLRAKPEWCDTPVLMLSARSQEKDVRRALDAGATDYVVKPFLPEELKARIRRLIPQH